MLVDIREQEKEGECQKEKCLAEGRERPSEPERAGKRGRKSGASRPPGHSRLEKKEKAGPKKKAKVKPTRARLLNAAGEKRKKKEGEEKREISVPRFLRWDEREGRLESRGKKGGPAPGHRAGTVYQASAVRGKKRKGKENGL